MLNPGLHHSLSPDCRHNYDDVQRTSENRRPESQLQTLGRIFRLDRQVKRYIILNRLIPSGVQSTCGRCQDSSGYSRERSIGTLEWN